MMKKDKKIKFSGLKLCKILFRLINYKFGRKKNIFVNKKRYYPHQIPIKSTTLVVFCSIKKIYLCVHVYIYGYIHIH